MMIGRFMVEACFTNGYSEDPPADVSIDLATDGKTVWISGHSKNWHSDNPQRLPLTPRGWAQLADHAARLVAESNAAWTRMGSVKQPSD